MDTEWDWGDTKYFPRCLSIGHESAWITRITRENSRSALRKVSFRLQVKCKEKETIKENKHKRSNDSEQQNKAVLHPLHFKVRRSGKRKSGKKN